MAVRMTLLRGASRKFESGFFTSDIAIRRDEEEIKEFESGDEDILKIDEDEEEMKFNTR